MNTPIDTMIDSIQEWKTDINNDINTKKNMPQKNDELKKEIVAQENISGLFKDSINALDDYKHNRHLVKPKRNVFGIRKR